MRKWYMTMCERPCYELGSAAYGFCVVFAALWVGRYLCVYVCVSTLCVVHVTVIWNGTGSNQT